MPKRIHGAAGAQQSLSANLETYLMYCISPGAYTDPNPNPPSSEELTRAINIFVTGNILDQSQKNFEILFQSVSLRSVPVVMSDPIPVLDLQYEGAPSLTGEGFIWKFSHERTDTWMDYSTNDPIGILVKELDGVILDSGVRITTVDGSSSGVPKNVEFEKLDGFLC